MPFVSAAQRAWMHINHPDIAKRWDAETPKGAILPQHVADLKKPKSRVSKAFAKMRKRIKKKTYG